MNLGWLAAIAPRTLKTRLILVVLVAFAGLAFVMDRYVNQRLEQGYSRSGQAIVTAIATTFSDDFDEGLLRRPAELERRLDRLQDLNPGIRKVNVYTADGGGRHVASTDAGDLTKPVGAHDLEPIRTGKSVYEEEREGETHLGELNFALREPGRARVASLGLHYDLLPLDAALERDRRFVTLLTAGLALVFALALLLVLRLAVLRPLGRLSDAAQRIGAGEANVRLGWRRQDELGQVAAEFDGMAAELERTHRHVEALALTDPLTGLLNHRSFRESVEDGLARATREERTLSVLAIDVDDFKGINDVHGHAAGDQTLREVAACIVAELRPGDVCGRVGGDEFAVMLDGTSAPTAATVAERLRASVASLRLGANTSTAVSIGISRGAAWRPLARSVVSAAVAAVTTVAVAVFLATMVLGLVVGPAAAAAAVAVVVAAAVLELGLAAAAVAVVVAAAVLELGLAAAVVAGARARSLATTLAVYGLAGGGRLRGGRGGGRGGCWAGGRVVARGECRGGEDADRQGRDPGGDLLAWSSHAQQDAQGLGKPPPSAG
ncbi:MAG TPA: GGDEF domain-containing protein [Solirubrobacteraceae bacterium]|nr:GGDEF domain-containing protein [Solirubrobacteraceae bacterium]